MIKSVKLSRRDFLKRTASIAGAAFAIPAIVPSTVFGANVPSSRITMGCIGLGGQGTWNMLGFLNNPDVQVVALCDVNAGSDDYDMLYQFKGSSSAGLQHAIDRARKATAESFIGFDTYSDFRDLLARDDIDTVTVCTPDHWHALVSIAAAKAGKDIYCEKPLANSVAEGRAVCDAVKRYGRILQTGSHERSNDSARFACELVRNGRIGKIHTVHVSMPTNEPHHDTLRSRFKPQPVTPVPEGLDYDMWLGHTPQVPYIRARCHFWWRFNHTYGGGEMTDRGAHVLDIVQLGLNTDDTGPVEIAGCGNAPKEGVYNAFMEFNFECKYANGVRLIGKSEGTRGIKFEGTDGWIFVHIHGGRLEAQPQSLLRETIGPNEIHLGRSPGHHQDFINAVKSRGTTIATPEIGHRTASLCHLINIAMLRGRKLNWDPKMEKFTNDDIANKMLTPTMRPPWHL